MPVIDSWVRKLETNNNFSFNLLQIKYVVSHRLLLIKYMPVIISHRLLGIKYIVYIKK